MCGLLLLDRRQTATRIADWLPGRAHDALNRLLVHPPITTHRLFDHVIQWAKQLGSGYLVVDEVVLEKPYGTNLAFEMLQEVALSGLSIQYVAFDNFYTAGWLTKAISQLGWTWVGILETKAHVRYHRRLWQAGQLATSVKLKWRSAFRLRAASFIAYLPKYGTLRLVVTRTRFGNFQVLASNDLAADLAWIIERKRRRWTVETLFRDAKQFCGFTACQCWLDVAQVMPIAFVLLAFIVCKCSAEIQKKPWVRSKNACNDMPWSVT